MKLTQFAADDDSHSGDGLPRHGWDGTLTVVGDRERAYRQIGSPAKKSSATDGPCPQAPFVGSTTLKISQVFFIFI
jgi:hypothetical protein